MLRAMDYNIADIRTYIQVIESRSISEAAQRLGLSKSVVSERIAQLEASLQSKLVHRSTRGITPTDKGQLFYERMCELVGQLRSAVDEIADDKSSLCGKIRLTAPVTFGEDYVLPLLFGFLASHPDVDLALDLDDRFVDLRGSGYDLGIRIGRLQDSDLVARGLAPSRRIVCCSPGYADRFGQPRTLEELSGHQCIGYSTASSERFWQFAPARPGGELRTVNVRSRIRVNSGIAMREAAVAGLGLAMLPLFIAAPALREGQLINALPQVTPTSDTVYAVHPQSRYVSKAVRGLIDTFAAAFRDGPPWESGLPRDAVARP